MPKRHYPFVTGQIYHVFNHANRNDKLFTYENVIKHFLKILEYYRQHTPTVRLSYYQKWYKEHGENIQRDLISQHDTSVIAYGIMPNHFHLVLEQTMDRGISRYMSNIQNSFTRFYNTLEESRGHVFEGQFKAVLIESEEQLLHITRYVHLNPTTANLISFSELEHSIRTSFPSYINKSNLSWIDKSRIIDNSRSPKHYYDFVKDNADYQKTLSQIKKLSLD